MTVRRLFRYGTAGVVALCALTAVGAGTAQAADKTAIDKGGAFCLRMGTGAPGETVSIFSLDIDPADHPTRQRLWWVSGVERGANASVATQNYVNNLSGTATLAPPNNGRPGGKLIHMSLTGTSYGTFTDVNAPGLWTLDFALQLNPKTLKGTLTGLSVFTPISGTTAGPSTTLAVDQPVTQVSCKKA